MEPIDLALFDARDRALPGREMAELNELCRAIAELLRQPKQGQLSLFAHPTFTVVALRGADF
jgi:hypothetical protein